MERRTFLRLAAIVAPLGAAVSLPRGAAAQSTETSTEGSTQMSAFLIVTATVKDGAKMQEYSQKSGQTIGAAGGELVVRGMFDSALVGQAQHTMAAVIRFPNMAALTGWYGSDAYQALAELREEAADMTFAAYNVPS